jgi:hypothetical protein
MAAYASFSPRGAAFINSAFVVKRTVGRFLGIPALFRLLGAQVNFAT